MLFYQSGDHLRHVAGHVVINLEPAFAAFLAFSACAAFFFTRRPARNLAIASILSAALGYAFSFVAGFLIKLPYVFMAGALAAKILPEMRIRFRVDRTRTQMYLLVFWALALVSSLYTFQAPYLSMRAGNTFMHGLPIRSLIQNLQLALMLSFFYVTYEYCKNRGNWRHIVRLFGVCVLIIIGYGVYELLTLYFKGIPYLNLALPADSLGGYKAGGEDGKESNYILYRMHCFFNEPAGMASSLLFAIPLLTGEFLTVLRAKKHFKIILLIASVVALFLTTSNAAFMAALAGYLSVLFFMKKLKPMIFVTAIFLGVPWAAQELFQKAVAQKSGSVVVEAGRKRNLIIENFHETVTVRNYRYDTWMQALGIFMKNPVLGIGLGNYSFWFDGDSVEGTASLFMQILVELGSVGMIVFLLFLASILWELRKLFVLRRQDPEIYIYAIAMIGCLVAGLVHRMSFDALTGDPLLWVLLGMAAALPRIPREEAAQQR